MSNALSRLLRGGGQLPTPKGDFKISLYTLAPLDKTQTLQVVHPALTSIRCCSTASGFALNVTQQLPIQRQGPSRNNAEAMIVARAGGGDQRQRQRRRGVGVAAALQLAAAAVLTVAAARAGDAALPNVDGVW
jgi:hypothetical protein